MKRVIDGLLYDTKTAEEIANYSRFYPSDFNHVAETLYKTANGNYFLAGKGGPRSKYAEQVEQNTWGGGEGIIPLAAKEALDWCEKNYIDADIIQAEFTLKDA